MVNWHDPALLFKDYLSLIKLNHALAGIYIWETVFTAGFELDILRGKRPYRLTIWLYLGTRYTALLAFIMFFIDKDGGKVPCQPIMITSFALPYASWAFASLIIVLRVIAIWNRNILVSLISVGIWLGGLGLNIRNLTMVEGSYNTILETCVVLHTRKGLVNAIGALAVDVVLCMAMLIGLLRHAHGSSTGIWHLLYQQCIIWIVLAGLAEIPPVVFLILNLNDAWNEMFTGVSITILAIGAARMYRSLCRHGSLTEYVSSEPPQFSLVVPMSNPQRRSTSVYGRMHFAAATQLNGTGTTLDTPVFLPTDHIQLEFIPGASDPGLVHENTKGKAGYEMA